MWPIIGIIGSVLTGIGALFEGSYMIHGLTKYKSLDDVETFDKDMEKKHKEEETE